MTEDRAVQVPIRGGFDGYGVRRRGFFERVAVAPTEFHVKHKWLFEAYPITAVYFSLPERAVPIVPGVPVRGIDGKITGRAPGVGPTRNRLEYGPDRPGRAPETGTRTR